MIHCKSDVAATTDQILVGSNVKFERIRRITGYLVGTLDRFNNDPDNIASGKAPVLSDPNDPKSAPISFSSQSV